MKAFVFVVCGSREHVDTLNYSLRFIRHFSHYPIVVLTDPKRNEVPILHNNIIEVETPAHFDHHQASIYLKTGIHKFLDMEPGNMYCYLDSDIVAISPEINSIFNHFAEPIIFAPDHCLFDEFSPHAMNCGCLADVLRREREYASVDAFFNQEIFVRMQQHIPEKQVLDKHFGDMKKLGIKSLVMALSYITHRYLMPHNSFKLGRFRFDKSKRLWYNEKNEVIHYDFDFYAKRIYRKFHNETGMHFDKKRNIWVNSNGLDITPIPAKCSHLQEHIQNKFNIQIPANWQHWNGGVFLFNNNSQYFLDYWHRITIEEFDDPATKTRDQATLAVTRWKFGLEYAPCLFKRFNFITEYDNSRIAWSKEKGFTYDDFETEFEPYFLHIYHEWGHKGWSIWDFVEELEGVILE